MQLAAAAVEEDRGALGDAQHLGAGRHDDGDVAGPGQDRRVRGRAPLGEDDAGHQVEVQAGRLGGRQVAGHQDTLRRHPPGGLAGQGPQHLVADRVDVRRPLPQVGVGQARPLALDVGQAAGPGGDRPDPGAGAGLDVGEHLGVGEQGEVRVEDARLLRAHFAGGDDPDVLDVAAHGGHGLHDAPPFGGRLPHRLLVEVDRHGGQPAHRADRDPG